MCCAAWTPPRMTSPAIRSRTPHWMCWRQHAVDGTSHGLSWLQARFGEDYINEADPSVLRFLIASRDEVSSKQLRDDLLSMLVAGHETTGSVLTWTLYLLEQNPSAMAKVHTYFAWCRLRSHHLRNVRGEKIPSCGSE